jgi:hypothetical protein
MTGPTLNLGPGALWLGPMWEEQRRLPLSPPLLRDPFADVRRQVAEHRAREARFVALFRAPGRG